MQILAAGGRVWRDGWGDLCSIHGAGKGADGWTHSLCKVTAGMLRLFRYRLAEFTPHSKEPR